MSRIAVETQKIKSESPIRIATCQCLAATLASHDSTRTIPNRSWTQCHTNGKLQACDIVAPAKTFVLKLTNSRALGLLAGPGTRINVSNWSSAGFTRM